MKEIYHKTLIEENRFFSVYHGKGYYNSDENNSLFHYDPSFTLSYFISCKGSIKIEGNSYPVKSGDVIIMMPEEIHRFFSEKGAFHERISIHIHPCFKDSFPFPCEELLKLFKNKIPGKGNLIEADIISASGIDKIIKNILLLAKDNKVLCLCKIAELLSKCNNISGIEKDLSVKPLVSDVISYISEHFTEEINSSLIADEFFISRSRLEHLFKENTGVSLWDYVIIRRLIFFNELMDLNFAIKDAVSKAGFNNYSNFYRLYKKHMGYSPSEYKQKAVR